MTISDLLKRALDAGAHDTTIMICGDRSEVSFSRYQGGDMPPTISITAGEAETLIVGLAGHCAPGWRAPLSEGKIEDTAALGLAAEVAYLRYLTEDLRHLGRAGDRSLTVRAILRS